MRYAILADIHGNLEALTAVIEDAAAQRVDQWHCAGDLVGYGADPQACLAALHAREVLAVAGNHDAACLGKIDPHTLTSAGRHVILWTRDRLGFAELDALRRLPLTAGDDFLSLVHGSPRNPERFAGLSEPGRVADAAGSCRTPYCAVGHTHWPAAFICRGRPWRVQAVHAPQELAELRVPAEPETRCFLNPGSVGQPRDGDPRASYGILDTDRAVWSVRRVAYDVAAAQRKIRAAGLPELLADRLAVGR
jgi:diadenosine tetraphosphatase ApaH/serine/threonine PP2A family protein phosphatase